MWDGKWEHCGTGSPRWSSEAVQAVGGDDMVLRAAGSDDYQGWGAVLTTDHRVLTWGYGSCSGCDYYEGSDDVAGDLVHNITQYDTAEEALAAFEAH